MKPHEKIYCTVPDKKWLVSDQPYTILDIVEETDLGRVGYLVELTELPGMLWNSKRFAELAS